MDHGSRRRSLREEDIDIIPSFLLTSLIFSCFTGMVFNLVRPGILNIFKMTLASLNRDYVSGRIELGK